MKICQIFHRDYPWDVRVEKICRSLQKSGNDIHLICNNSKQRRSEELQDGINIHRLPSLKSKRLNHIISFPAFFNLYWIFHIYRMTRKHKFTVFLVRDLPLVLATWIVAKKLKIPLVYDMAENFPAMLKNFTSTLKSPFLANILEAIAIRLADHVLVVVEESKERIIGKGIAPEKVSLVSNTPELELLQSNLAMYQRHIFENKRLNLLYVGYITRLRGLDVVIQSLKLLDKTVDDVFLTIIGDGIELNNLKVLAQKLDVEDRVYFTGWIDFHYIPSIISQCDIGIIPHYSNDHTDSTIPNKLFDYIAFSKPVIVSDARPLKRIVRNTGCGVVFRSGSPHDFAAALLKLTDAKQRGKLGTKGRIAVLELYNWNRDSRRLLSVFNNLHHHKTTT